LQIRPVKFEHSEFESYVPLYCQIFRWDSVLDSTERSKHGYFVDRLYFCMVCRENPVDDDAEDTGETHLETDSRGYDASLSKFIELAVRV
jgi:hypothetical protein